MYNWFHTTLYTWLLTVLTKTGETLQARGMIYKLVAQTVLLFGSKSCLGTGEMLKVLNFFHHGASQHIIGMTTQCTEYG